VIKITFIRDQFGFLLRRYVIIVTHQFLDFRDYVEWTVMKPTRRFSIRFCGLLALARLNVNSMGMLKIFKFKKDAQAESVSFDNRRALIPFCSAVARAKADRALGQVKRSITTVDRRLQNKVMVHFSYCEGEQPWDRE